ncbi:hypothetical protein ACE1TI_13245 [Alteribacillus sp. JSM 102045]|uniref:hypothetical protein n=1 Tax=Alteribacillus sp. JSM 102045 TaxID=1562101 RepID=UPI0035C1F345
MFASMMEIMLAAVTVGAASVYTRDKQTMLSVLFILFFASFAYLGFLLSSYHIIYLEQLHWTVNVVRFLLVVSIGAAAMFSFIPYQGFFHSQSKHLWLAVSVFYLFIGWHAGHWFGSWYMFTGLIIMFIIFYVSGNILQGMVHIKLRQRQIAAYFPFLILLLFSILLLL